MTTSDKPRRRLLYRPPLKFRSSGAAGMTWSTTFIGLGLGVIMVIGFMLPWSGWIKFVLWPLFLAILFVPLVISFNGRSLWEVLLGIIGRGRQTAAGEHMYRSGPFTAIPYGHPLPGLGTSTKAFDVHPPDNGEPFGLVNMRAKRTYTVILRAWPQGAEWNDSIRKDLWVARLGDTLAFIAQSPDVRAVVPIIETVPESGQRASAMVRNRLDPDAPNICKQGIVEAVEEVPTAEVRLEGRIAITIAADTAFRKRDAGETGTDISRRIRRIMDYFEMSGVVVRPMLEHEITATTRRACSPGNEYDIEQGLMTGEPMHLDWEDVGPISASDQHAMFVHDGVKSVSWTLEGPPEAAFDSRILQDLLTARAEIPRKRVAFIYGPYTPAAATTIVNKDDADTRQAIRSHVGRLDERTIVRREQAEAARAEQARGAGMTRISMIITATCPVEGDLAKLETQITNLTTGSSLKVRPANDQQGPTFLAGLGIGILLSDMASTSDKLAA